MSSWSLVAISLAALMSLRIHRQHPRCSRYIPLHCSLGRAKILVSVISYFMDIFRAGARITKSMWEKSGPSLGLTGNSVLSVEALDGGIAKPS